MFSNRLKYGSCVNSPGTALSGQTASKTCLSFNWRPISSSVERISASNCGDHFLYWSIFGCITAALTLNSALGAGRESVHLPNPTTPTNMHAAKISWKTAPLKLTLPENANPIETPTKATAKLTPYTPVKEAICSAGGKFHWEYPNITHGNPSA